MFHRQSGNFSVAAAAFLWTSKTFGLRCDGTAPKGASPCANNNTDGATKRRPVGIMVDESGFAPESYAVGLRFLHTYSAFKLCPCSDGRALRGACRKNTVHRAWQARQRVCRLNNAAICQRQASSDGQR